MDAETAGAQTGGARRAPGPAGPPSWVGLPGPCPPLGEEATQERAEALYRKLTAGRKPAPKGGQPHLVLTIGAAGSGKSTVARLLVKHKSGHPPGSYVDFDSDEVLDLFPEGEAIRNARDTAGRPTGVGLALGWADCIGGTGEYGYRALMRVLGEGYNLIVQSHGHAILMEAQKRGYVCTLLYVAVSRETALARAAARAHLLGRYAGPGATAENGWGWGPAVEHAWHEYRHSAPWYALWADSFVVVSNERDGVYPGAGDFRVYDCHPPLGEGQDWRGVVGGFYDAIAAAHGEK